MKIISGHQPVYIPWLGLIHKASLADVFVFMDDVQYLSNDWNNRNKIKTPQGKSMWLTVPVDLKNSASLLLKDILIAEEKTIPEKKRWQNVHWSSIKMAYGKSRYFREYNSFFEWFYLEAKWEKLADLNFVILEKIFNWLDISARLVIASRLDFTNKKSDLVLEHAQRFHGDIIVTGIHGKDYMDVEKAKKMGVKVVFQDYKHPVYTQRFGDFVSHLSFIDIMFNHGPHSMEICLENNLTRDAICNSKKQ